MFDLKNKIIIITGAGGFLGKSFCKFLLLFKAQIVAIDNSQKKLNYLKKIIEELDIDKKKFYLIKCNITSESEVKKARNKILKKFKKIDVLINNATFRPKNLKNYYRPFENFNLSDWKEVSSVDSDGTFLMIKHFCNIMKKRREGSIINIGSVYSQLAPNFEIYKDSFYKGVKMNSPAVYSVNKFGINGLTRYLASYLGKYKIRVNCISPGGIQNDHSKKFIKNYSSKVPLNRMGNINDLIGVVVLLSSNKSSFITGQNILVDGGLSCW